MARLLGPDPSTRTITQARGRKTYEFSGRPATVYTDAAATVLASIAAYDGTGTPGATISGSVVRVGAESRLPRFWFPSDGTDTLYVRVVGLNEIREIHADEDARLDAGVGKGDLFINVKDAPYNAKGDNSTNDTAAIVAAVTAAAGGRTVYFPNGTYKVNPGAIAPAAACRLVGENATTTKILTTAASRTGVGITVNSPNVEISNLYVSGFYAGIDNRKWYTKIYDNKLTGNTIGIDFSLDSYIIRARANEITFNDVGIMVRGAAQAYQLNITENVIDNNNGVGIAISTSSGGLVIENNTIEGNRNYTSNVGCGILLRGSNMSRLKINGNWFEVNGNHATTAADIFMLAPGSDSTTGAALRTAIVGVLPTDLQTVFATSGAGVGSVSITENAFIATKYNIVVSGDKSTVAISRNTFKGVKDKNNKHIFINVPAGTYGLGGTRVTIDNNNYRNTDDATIDAQVTTGIDGTIVYSDQTFNATAADRYYYNGVDLRASTGLKPQYLEVAGTTGAPNAGRFVGVTDSGAPTTGTYAVGDYVVSKNGNMFVCVAAGTPGTWVTPRDTTNLLASGEETIPRDTDMSFLTANSGNVYLTYGTFRRSETTTQVRITTGTTAAAATPTLCRIGLYTIAANGAGTLVADVANDTTLFAGVATTYTRSWTTPYAKVAGQRYAVGVIVVTGVTAPQICGSSIIRGTEPALAPRLCGHLASQTDLPSSFVDASVTANSSRMYAAIAP